MPFLVILATVALIVAHQLRRGIPPKHHKLDWIARKHGFANYAAYLASPHWSKMKRIIHKMYKEHCHICNAGPSAPKRVHHRTYDRLNHESVMDLVLLCDKCHTETHEYSRHQHVPLTEADTDLRRRRRREAA